MKIVQKKKQKRKNEKNGFFCQYFERFRLNMIQRHFECNEIYKFSEDESDIRNFYYFLSSHS